MPIQQPVARDMDLRGCYRSAGYTWCQILGKCIRLWETACAYPKNCLTWYDGCNTCQLDKGELGLCTDAFCYTTDTYTPYCMVPAPGAYHDPVDTVLNPFLGGN